MALDASVHMLVDHFVEVDEALHAGLVQRLFGLLFFGRADLHHVFVLFFVLCELLLEGAHELLLLLLRRLWLQLVDRSNESVFERRVLGLVLLLLVHGRLEVAVEEVEARDSVPRLEHVSVEDHDSLVVEHFSEGLFPALHHFALSLGVELLGGDTGLLGLFEGAECFHATFNIFELFFLICGFLHRLRSAEQMSPSCL